MHKVNMAPNPQGKGLALVMDSLTASRARLAVPAKPLEQLANELFTSLFILNSQFKFKPVIDGVYWLYRQKNQYKLSLIAPQQWTPAQYGQFIGECKLRTDLTWTLQLAPECSKDTDLIRELALQRERFQQKLEAAESVEHLLPVYIDTLPFYQRVLTSALAHSLSLSIKQAGFKGLSYSQAQRLLTSQEINHHLKQIV